MRRLSCLALVVVLPACTDYGPPVTALDEVATFISDKHKSLGCSELAKPLSNYANDRADALMKLPSKYDNDKDKKLASLMEKYGSKVKDACKTMKKGVFACRLDGASNISGHAQSTIDLCKLVLGIEEDKKWGPEK